LRPGDERVHNDTPWHEHGNPTVKKLITTIRQSGQGLKGLVATLDDSAVECLAGKGLHLEETGHADRKKAYAQVTKANALLQEALAKLKEAATHLNHS
jgi:hypothetical protein